MNKHLLIGVMSCFVASARLFARDLVQVTNYFNTDPGWEAVNNRVRAENPLKKKNDFGWLPATATSNGAIGGSIWRSRTPAWYGMRLGPLSFNDRLSASGTLMLDTRATHGGAYFGFFNHTRQEWRPWSSIAVRLGEARQEPDKTVTSDFTLDYMSMGWKAGGYSAGRLPVDGKFHRWSFVYDPEATVAREWPHPKLKDWMGDKRITEIALLETARRDVPQLTLKQLSAWLEEAEYRGQVEFHTRRGTGWQIRPKPGEVKGRFVCTLDDGPRKTHFVNQTIRQEALELDRFGIFNMQLPGDEFAFYLANLTINGQLIDLKQDPGWEGKNNQLEFLDHDFHAKQDFGFSPTRHAGGSSGEIGGTFWRTEPIDPLHGYYATEVGTLTLDDRLEFSGKIAFTAGGTDAGMVFGYFNTRDKMATFSLDQGGEAGAPLPNTMFVAIEGPTRIGYYFSAQLCAGQRSLQGHSDGPVFVPNGEQHTFRFRYDPVENNGLGRITLTLDNKDYPYNLTREQRQSGANFNRFGLMNVRRGGKYVEVYLDDLVYTSEKLAPSQKHAQTVVTVPYPEGGRKY